MRVTKISLTKNFALLKILLNEIAQKSNLKFLTICVVFQQTNFDVWILLFLFYFGITEIFFTFYTILRWWCLKILKVCAENIMQYISNDKKKAIQILSCQKNWNCCHHHYCLFLCCHIMLSSWKSSKAFQYLLLLLCIIWIFFCMCPIPTMKHVDISLSTVCII